MRTLNISISDLDYANFGIPSERLSFSEFVDLISRRLPRQRLHETVAAAERARLSEMQWMKSPKK